MMSPGRRSNLHSQQTQSKSKAQSQAQRSTRAAPPLLLPPPAIFSRTSSVDILELKEQYSSNVGDSASDRSIRSEVFGGGNEYVRNNIEKQRRVQARQAAAEEKTMARKMRNKQMHMQSRRVGGGSCDSTVSSGNYTHSISTLQSIKSNQSTGIQPSHQSLKSHPQENEVDHERMICLQETLEGLAEEKAWYLQTPQEMLKAEQMQQQLELLEQQRDNQLSRSNNDDARESSLGSLCCSTSLKHEQHPEEYDDEASCVSSLSANSARGDNQLSKTRNKNSHATGNYTVRALKSRKVIPPKTVSQSPRISVPSSPAKRGTQSKCLPSTPSSSSKSMGNHPFLATKTVPRLVSPSKKTRPKHKINDSVDPLVESNTMLLLAPTEEEIAQKFLLTREVDAQIKDVEEEIKRLAAKQVEAKVFINKALTDAELKAQELQSTRENLAVMYDASNIVVQERLREQEIARKLETEKQQSEEAKVALREQQLQEFRQVSVEQLEKENTIKKSQLYSSSQHKNQLQHRNDGYLPREQTVNNPAAVLHKFERIDYLWNQLRKHAREVGRKRVAVKRAL